MKFYLLVFSALITIVSCKKSDSPTPPPPPPPVVDSTTLVKLLVLDSTKAAPLDTFVMYRFDYDISKRLTKLTAQTYNTTSLVLETRFTFTYYYNGTDTLPYRVAEFNQPSSNYTLNWNHLLSFDAQARQTRDSSTEVTTMSSTTSTNLATFRYTYVADGFIDSIFAYQPTPGINAKKTIVTKDANNNIIKQRAENSNTATEVLYDNHVNPLFKASLGYPYLINSTFPSFFVGKTITVQKYNFAKLSTNNYDASNTTILSSFSTYFNITYKANGLPAIIRLSAVPPPAPSSDKYKYVFVYGI